MKTKKASTVSDNTSKQVTKITRELKAKFGDDLPEVIKAARILRPDLFKPGMTMHAVYATIA